MELRHATEQDVDFILEAARQSHSDFDGAEFDQNTTLDTIYAFLDKEDTSESMLVVAGDEEGYRGVVAGMLVLYPFSTEIIATEPLFWTDGKISSFKVLHEVYQKWAESVDADVIQISAPPTKDQKKWSKFYKSLGYEDYEYKFSKRKG